MRDSDDDPRPLVLMLRTARREFREYLMRSITARYRVHMFLGLAPTWEREYIAGSTHFDDTLDTAALVAAARDLHARQPVAGVLTWDESRTPQTAAIAAALGLPGGDPEVVARCRDKHLTRRALDAAAVPQPRSVRVTGLAEAHAAAARLGYPVIIKPSDLALSLGVVKVTSPDELARHFAATSALRVRDLPDYRVTVLVEEYADGPEISVDCAVRHGEVTPLCLARKEIGYPPYCFEIGHHVDAADPLLDDERLMAVVRDAHAALGFRDGMTHTEIKLTARGPKIIEVNARLGGDLIPYLGLRATGVDTGLAAANVAVGRPALDTPHPAPGREGREGRGLVAGVRFLHVARDNTRIESVRFATENLPPAIDQLVVLATPGEIRSTPPTDPYLPRIAFATAVAKTLKECGAALDAAENALRVNDTTPAKT